MLGLRLHGPGDGEAVRLVHLCQGGGACQTDLACGQGASLVHHDPVGLGQHVQHMTTAQQNAVAGQIGGGRG